ncbi:MAG: hypothetical protein IPG17_23970 [Sandaracinaceae bacterium]|nr:hypothetical protein [Sandaracinaceae bacterium]MBP7684690.1 hypothetical protein [Deltaproteobacteria bacterium]MBK6813658.1 hypothetical protein [Sandaracinaceae bacterium]MBK7154185.1 hypothetical protein [Sandaracinaceae bacterium]MBK7776332.1 hypothetical protein [Sandaracinaceae bacterium]
MRLAPTLLASLALLLGLVAHAPEHAEARCARALWIPTLVTPTEQPLPTNATFLVAMMLEFDMQNQAIQGRFPEDAALVRQVGEGDATTEERISLRVVPIGAGLARYEPSTRPRDGVYQLVGLGRARPITFGGRGALRVSPPRPPSRVELNVGPMRVQGGSGGVVTTRAVRATLPAPVTGPPTALIAYWDGEPGAAALVPQGVTEVVLFRDSIHCASPLAGTRAPRAGEERELATVDAFGRVSRRARQ